MILKRRNCYLADGSGELAPVAVPLEWLEGVRTTVPWQARKASGAPLDLSNAANVLMVFRRHDTDGVSFLTLQANITGAPTGLFEFTALPSHAALLARGFYLHEIILQDEFGVFSPLVLRSRLQIRPADASSGSLAVSPVYFGSAAAPVVIDETFITSLSGLAFKASRATTINFTSTAGKFGWYSFPSAFGGTSADFIDTESMLEAGLSLVATITIAGVSYSVWRTDVAGLGSWTLEAM